MLEFDPDGYQRFNMAEKKPVPPDLPAQSWEQKARRDEPAGAVDFEAESTNVP
jgi:hypothetical protein